MPPRGVLSGGELKHGPLALVDADMPVIVVAPNNALLEKLKSNLQEVRARGGELYVFATATPASKCRTSSTSSTSMVSPKRPPSRQSSITVPLQLLGVPRVGLKGTDVDHPRNLAKSVTVE